MGFALPHTSGKRNRHCRTTVERGKGGILASAATSKTRGAWIMTDYTNLPSPPGVEEKPSAAVVLAFTEGPAVDADGTVYFSDIMNNRILKRTTDGVLSVFREPGGRTNGNTFDREGRLLHCEGAEFGPGGGRRVTRTDLKTGKYEVLTDRYDGVRYNSPNDICVDGHGRIYFTDPMYFDRTQ